MTWILFTKRTEDPKLGWLETRLAAAGIPSRRNGHAFHAPILEVPGDRLDDAWRILTLIDDMPDDDPMWTDDPDGCACSEDQCSFCAVREEVRSLRTPGEKP